MPKVILDTNALLLPFERSINLDLDVRRLIGECEMFVPGPLIGELKRSTSRHAQAALRLAGRYHIEQTNSSGDASVIELAKKLNAYVVTNDRLLISKLIKERIKVITMRGKNHLELIER